MSRRFPGQGLRGILLALLAVAVVVVVVGLTRDRTTGRAGRQLSGGVSVSQHRRPTAPASAADDAGSARRSERVTASRAGWRLPEPLSRADAIGKGNRIVLAGGLTRGDRSVATVTALATSSGGSRLRLPSLARPVHDAAGALVGGRVLVFGGGTAVGTPTVQSAGAGGSRIVGALPYPLSDLSAATLGRTTYVFGGYTGSRLPAQILATTDGTTFRVVGSLHEPVRYAAVTTVDGLVVLAGGEDAAGKPARLIQVFDPATGHTRVVGRLPEAVSGAAATTLGNAVFVAGGRLGDGSVSDDISRWTPGSHRVRSAGRLPVAVANAAVATDHDRAWLLGGEASTQLATVQILRLGPAR
jgi:N-acetylneuraminic acid mutarotase